MKNKCVWWRHEWSEYKDIEEGDLVAVTDGSVDPSRVVGRYLIQEKRCKKYGFMG